MAEVAAKQRKHKMSRLEKKNTLIAYSFLAPNFLGFAIFTLVPVVCAILLAFVEWNGGDISNAHFVGLQNFAEIFKVDKVASKWANGDYLYFFNRVDLGIALKNTVFYALINVPLTLVCAIALALALNKAKGAVTFRAIFFFPYVASMVAICVCWNFMLMKDGPVNQMIMALGINFNKYGDVGDYPRQRVALDGLLHGHLPRCAAGRSARTLRSSDGGRREQVAAVPQCDPAAD